jgi:putative heme-binding domain-containing protein
VQWTTADGRTWTGVPHSGPGEEGLEKLVGADGQLVAVPSEQIVERNTLNTSIMPTGLQDQLTQKELSDLLAFLLQRP